MGYSILDLRTAQQKTELKFDWKPLLSSKYKGTSASRPELFYALQLQKQDETQDDQLESLPSEPRSFMSSLEAFNYDKELCLKVSNGYHKIWDSNANSETDCQELYNLTIITASTSDLHKFLKPKSKSGQLYHFVFSLFGSMFKSRTFTDLRSSESSGDKITYKIAAPNLSTLAAYFSLNSTMEVQFRDSRRPLGLVTISLNGLVGKNGGTELVGEFKVCIVYWKVYPITNSPLL